MWHKQTIQSLVMTLLDIHESAVISRAPLLSIDGWATTCMIILFENYHIVIMFQIFSNSGFLEILLGKCHKILILIITNKFQIIIKVYKYGPQI